MHGFSPLGLGGVGVGVGAQGPNASEVAAVAQAVRDGVITYHAFPFNAEPELADAELIKGGIAAVHALDARFGQPKKTVMSQRDVPGTQWSRLGLGLGPTVVRCLVGESPRWYVVALVCSVRPTRASRGALFTCAVRVSALCSPCRFAPAPTRNAFHSRRVFRHITALVAGFRLPTHPVGGGIVLFVTSWPRLAVTAGVTRGIVPVLAEAGVLAFSEGANSQIVPPEVRNRAGQGLNSGHYSAVSASSATFSVRGDPMPLAMLVGCHREVNCNARRLSVCNHGCVLQELTLSFSNRVDGT